eukprot:356041-Chlamydomonas_euryale.AAC.1
MAGRPNTSAAVCTRDLPVAASLATCASVTPPGPKPRRQLSMRPSFSAASSTSYERSRRYQLHGVSGRRPRLVWIEFGFGWGLRTWWQMPESGCQGWIFRHSLNAV